MGVFRFRALLALDPPAPGRDLRQHAFPTHSLMIHVEHVCGHTCDKYLPAVIVPDTEQPLRQGQRAVVTVTVTDEDAPLYLGAGQPFTIWGDHPGHGLISRRVFTDGEPS